MTVHEKKLEKARDAIEVLFSDTTVSNEKTLESLEALADDIRIKVKCLVRCI